MKSLIIVLVVPVFLLFLYVEYYLSKRKNKDVFKYGSSISNISIGITERFVNLFVAGFFYNVFVWVYEDFRFFSIPNTWYSGIGLLILADFVWYWYHRLGHQINIFWAAHIVHHHSEEFNFTAATRITTIQAFIRTPFWCFLPLLGFHPNQVMVILVVHGAYSFFTHTQVVNAPKWLEKVFITPSLHGIHHASNEKYLDKNFGDVFVFWDKLFRTFMQEEEKPFYGITHPLNRSSFLWQHFHYYFEIFEAVKRETSFKNKLKIVFGNPGVMDQNIRTEVEKLFFNQDRKTAISNNIKKYVNSQLLFSLFFLVFATINFEGFSNFDKWIYSGILIITLINIGALLEQKKWIYYLEIFRFLFVTLLFQEFVQGWMIFVLLNVFLVLFLNKNIKNWYFEQFLEYEKQLV